MIGKTLGHYDIVELLGQGGMGQVYRARDTKLGREVAIKVLPPEMSSDPERIARFRREARSLASLSDPHVATLYGMEEAGDKTFLVMELVEGEDLAQRMKREKLSRDEALSIAIQIARGVEAAHARGIVHRDLKPANVMIDADGGVKILDFGLARAAADESDESADENSPTITADLTRAGTLLGTAAYMSPEQARGRAVDHRSDIWAFGVILYEMLRGERLFGGESVSDTLASVLKEEPAWSDLPGDLPPSIGRLLRRCLHKDRRERLQAIGDARLELQDADEAGAPTGAATSTSHRGAWIAAVIAALVLGVLGAKTFLTETPAVQDLVPTPVVRSTIPLPEGVRLDGAGTPVLAISPDGSHLAYVGREDGHAYLYIRSMATGETAKVPDSMGAEGPFFSPDGQWVGFGCGSLSVFDAGTPRLSKVSVEGGSPQTLCVLRDYFGGTWRGDGTIFWIDAQPGGVWSVSSDGGTPRETSMDEQTSIFWPSLMPEGDAVMVVDPTIRRGGAVVLVDVETGQTTDLGIEAGMAWPLPTGHLLLAAYDDSQVSLRRFDFGTRRALEGEAVVLRNASTVRNNGAALAVSAEGTLVYATGSLQGSRRGMTELVRLGLDGTITPLDLEPDRFASFALSPDGQQLAVSTAQGGISVIDLDRGTRLILPPGPTFEQYAPMWTLDGRELVWSGFGGGTTRGTINLYAQPADGVSPPRALESRVGEFWGQSWLPGTSVLVDIGWHTGAVGDFTTISTLPLDGAREPEPLLSMPDVTLRGPRVRPDGTWLAYTSDEGGDRVAYLTSLPDLRRKIPVGRADTVDWSVGGDRLFLRTGARIHVLTIDDDDDGGLVLGRDEDLATIEGIRGLQVDPLGRGLLILRNVSGTGIVTEIEMVRGWFTEVEQAFGGR